MYEIEPSRTDLAAEFQKTLGDRTALSSRLS